jgi:hypothetical protein
VLSLAPQPGGGGGVLGAARRADRGRGPDQPEPPARAVVAAVDRGRVSRRVEQRLDLELMGAVEPAAQVTVRCGQLAAAVAAAGLWPHTQPSAAMLAAYEADPELAALRLDFTATLGEMLEVMSAGLLTRGDRDDR